MKQKLNSILLIALFGLVLCSSFVTASIWSIYNCPSSLQVLVPLSRLECATLEVRKSLRDENYGNTTVFAYRVLSDTPPKAQLWVVAGEPNLATEVVESFFLPDVDMYVVHTIGTGLSSPVYCPNTISNMNTQIYDDWAACFHEVAENQQDSSVDLTQLGARHMVETLKLFIENSQERSDRVFMMGVSRLGTYITNMYMTYYPDTLKGVILDGTVAGGFSNYLSSFDLERERVILDYVAGCAEDTFCLGYLGADPVKFTRDTFESLYSGHCQDVVQAFGTPEDLSRVMSYVLFPNAESRAAVTAMIHRLNRCDEGDVAILKAIAKMTLPKLPTIMKMNLTATLVDSNLFVRQHMELSEMAYNAMKPDEMKERISQSVFRVYSHDMMISRLINELPWMLATQDPFWGAVPSADQLPVLMVSGKYDTETPLYIANDVASRLKNVKHIVVPNGGHLNIHRDTTCGQSGVRKFIASGSLDDAKVSEECFNEYFKRSYKAPKFESDLKLQLANMLYTSTSDPYFAKFSLYGEIPSSTVGLIVGLTILGFVVIGGAVTLIVLVKKGVITIRRPFKKMEDEMSA